MFKPKTPEQLAEKQAREAEKARQQAQRQAEQQRRLYEATPVGRAELAYGRGDQVFQYAHDVMSQQAIIVVMVGSTTKATATDPSAILNAVCNQGWELITGSFVFVVQGEESRDKFLASGQQVAVKGTTVGYYLFRRCPENKRSPEAETGPAEGLVTRA